MYKDAGAAHTSCEGPEPILPTILAKDKLPAEEKTFKRVLDEAMFIMVAGTDAPSQVLALTMFYILRDGEVYRRLKAELATGFPDPESLTSGELQQLPYLVRQLFIFG